MASKKIITNDTTEVIQTVSEAENNHKGFKHILLLGKHKTYDLTSFLQKIGTFLKTQGIQVSMDDSTKEYNPTLVFDVLDEKDYAKIDLAIVVGGDGSMMGAARRWGVLGVPLLGINYGRIGFLTDISSKTVLEDLQKILSGSFKREKRDILSIQVSCNDTIVQQGIAINDLVIGRGVSGKLLEFTVFCDNEFMYSQHADGIIVANPTGSTAYALAAGGSILHPGSPVFSVVPVCPQKLSNRPIILPNTVKIKVFFSGIEAIDYYLDGIKPEPAKANSQFLVEKNEKHITLIHPTSYSYFEGLREKLNWNLSQF